MAGHKFTPASRLKNKLNNCRGATTVEAASALPVLFFLVFGIISIGQILIAYVFTLDALRQSSREAMLRGANCEAVALVGVRSRVAQALFRPNISEVRLSFASHDGISGAVFELSGQMNCAACGSIFGEALNFSAATFVPLELPHSCEA